MKEEATHFLDALRRSYIMWATRLPLVSEEEERPEAVLG